MSTTPPPASSPHVSLSPRFALLRLGVSPLFGCDGELVTLAVLFIHSHPPNKRLCCSDVGKQRDVGSAARRHPRRRRLLAEARAHRGAAEHLAARGAPEARSRGWFGGGGSQGKAAVQGH